MGKGPVTNYLLHTHFTLYCSAEASRGSHEVQHGGTPETFPFTFPASCANQSIVSTVITNQIIRKSLISFPRSNPGIPFPLFMFVKFAKRAFASKECRRCCRQRWRAVAVAIRQQQQRQQQQQLPQHLHHHHHHHHHQHHHHQPQQRPPPKQPSPPRKTRQLCQSLPRPPRFGKRRGLRRATGASKCGSYLTTWSGSRRRR